MNSAGAGSVRSPLASARERSVRRRWTGTVIAVLASVLAVAGASAPAAFAGAVIPTSSEAGESTTVINSYVSVPLARNDDGTWPCGGSGNSPPECPGPEGQTEPQAYPTGFPINFFGTKYTATFINNNGNVTFKEPLSQFTPESFTAFGSPIIAPFFADVDTRGESSAIVNFGTGTLGGHKVFVVNWPGVGCYNEVSSVLNNFQLILIDRPDRGTGENGDDFEIEFNYDTIQWDTGQASGGNAACLSEGEAGTSAFVGYTNGTEVEADRFQLPGSGVHEGFLDSNGATGLVHHDLNSTTLGRYLFSVINSAALS